MYFKYNISTTVCSNYSNQMKPNVKFEKRKMKIISVFEAKYSYMKIPLLHLIIRWSLVRAQVGPQVKSYNSKL